MAEYEAVTRKWGNSLGITLPLEVVEKEHLHPHQRIKVIVVKPSQTPRRTFGLLRGKWKRATQEIKDQTRAELYDA